MKNNWIQISVIRKENFQNYIEMLGLVQFLPCMVYLTEEGPRKDQMWETGISNIPKYRIQFISNFYRKGYTPHDLIRVKNPPS